MSLFRILCSAALAASVLSLQAQKPVTPPQGGKAISDHLIGIFFEDISESADGGLNADLIQNGAFEYNPTERAGWGPGTAWDMVRPSHSLGYLEPRQIDPLNDRNVNYMRVHIERVGHYSDFNGWTGFGLANSGYNGIRIEAGKSYDFSAFVRNADGVNKDLRIALTTSDKDNSILADTTLTITGKDWQKYTCTLTAKESCNNAQLQMLSQTTGIIDFDVVSLLPQDTFHGHGLRKDLAEALEALHPKFLRFPGGCIVHGGGDGLWDTYRWKNTIGPKEQRLGLKNCWGYHQSFEIGYYEFFQLCEDLGMEPLPILPCGVTCQGTNGGWGLKEQCQDAVPMSEMDEWAQDALDLIEWANGDATTTWGRKRAEAGHPEPFHLKYLGLGNEERISPEFAERFKYIYDKVTAAYPDIVIVGTCGPGSHAGERDYEAGWKLAEETGMPLIDEHYYEPRDYFFKPCQYDNYPRDRKTKVYMGEYSSKQGKNHWGDALAEAYYLMNVERNGDVVEMTSYAPLFARRDFTCWDPDLIYYDNERPYLSCSYYVQQMFGLSAGDWYYGDCVTFKDADPKADHVNQSVVLNTKKRELYVKVCNSTATAHQVSINLSPFRSLKPAATLTTLQGELESENGYDKQPIAPVTEAVKVKKQMEATIAPYSVVMYTIHL